MKFSLSSVVIGCALLACSVAQADTLKKVAESGKITLA
ncbi:MAG: amino acid ABC transporter substrate-binding protein, partial [Comamonadaceae bacterium]